MVVVNFFPNSSKPILPTMDRFSHLLLVEGARRLYCRSSCSGMLFYRGGNRIEKRRQSETFSPFFRSLCVSLSGADFFFSRRRELLVEDLTAHTKAGSSGYVNNVTN